ncbi:hypothetical protein TruAng_001193 [Truncatella angustata]|nr:hypothetical protein TruAng_001193 [Truncatella angustata]
MRHVIKAADDTLDQERKDGSCKVSGGKLQADSRRRRGGAMMRAIIGIADELANIGVIIYETVKDQSSAISNLDNMDQLRSAWSWK